MAKTIVFGGSFDPVHVEHTNILKAAVRELCADKVIVVPTKNPPHKSASKTPFFDRAEMARIAFSKVSANVIVDDIENRNDGVNYSSDNLPVLEKNTENSFTSSAATVCLRLKAGTSRSLS